jgi:signal transduction histidine kinase
MIDVFVRAVENGDPIEIIEATQIANSDCWFRVKISPISGNDHLAASVHITDITHEHQMEILHQERMKIYTQKLEKYNSDLKKMTQHLAEAMRRAEESDRLKSIFLANISHEIRTPMNAIMGFSELLDRPNLTEKKRTEFTSLIRERSHDLLSIINNVLDISQLEAGYTSLTVVEGNVDDLLVRMIETVKNEARLLQGKNIDFIKSNYLSQQIFRLDFPRLHQILINLLTNAVKFTQLGKIELSCRMNEPGVLLFIVRDTGMGIAPEKIESLFKPFRQADESIHKEFGGSGLGLAISKGLVELMKGKIWVESEPGIGSSFYFTVPLN